MVRAWVRFPRQFERAGRGVTHHCGSLYEQFSWLRNSNATRIFSVNQAPPTITFAPNTTSLSVAAGGSVTDTLTITSMGGYSGALQFSCTGLPQNATCSFQPATVTVSGTSGPQTTVVTIQTAGVPRHCDATSSLPVNNPVLPAAAFWAPGLLTMALCRQKAQAFSSRACHLVVLLSLVRWDVATERMWRREFLGSIDCARVKASASVTPAGTSTVKIAAANSGSTVQSFTLTLTVQ